MSLMLSVGVLVVGLAILWAIRFFQKPPSDNGEDKEEQKRLDDIRWTEYAITLSLAGVGYFLFFYTPINSITQRNGVIFCSICAVVNALRLIAAKRK